MYTYYETYYWKNRRPKGWKKLNKKEFCNRIAYRIVCDPYFKRFSIEKYNKGQFVDLVYDSALFDYRLLQEDQQQAWHKSLLSENNEEAVYLIKNQDDRIIIKETYFFKNGYCLSCSAHHPQGPLVSTQKMYYEILGDSFNGVTLFDREKRPILTKVYEVDEETNQFTRLIEEKKEIQPPVFSGC